MSYLVAIETAVPDYCHSQKDITSFFVKATDDVNAQRKLNYISDKSGITTRYSVLNDFSEPNEVNSLFTDPSIIPSITTRMDIYKNKANDLALKAILKIDKFDTLKQKITHIITVTCTGLFAPGLDVDLIHQLNLSPTTQRSSINFMGCNAAILALNAANNICISIANSTVLIVCVELCTIHFQNNTTDDFILANTLFSDGAAAAIVSSNPLLGSNISIKSFNSLLVYKGKRDMAWQLSETGFIMNLTSYVSELINGNMQAFFRGIDVDKKAIDFWAIHPGGKKIVDDFSKALELKKHQLQASYDVLNEYGNMSSPTILFVLKQVLGSAIKAEKGNTIFVAAFGPGISIETMQLQYV